MLNWWKKCQWGKGIQYKLQIYDLKQVNILHFAKQTKKEKMNFCSVDAFYFKKKKKERKTYSVFLNQQR